MEERTAAYEDNFEGSRDFGDANSVNNLELASVFDGLPGGFGSVPRHGSRASKSRQVVESTQGERGMGDVKGNGRGITDKVT